MERDPFSDIFLKEIHRRVFDECFPRLVKCIQALSEEQLWYRPNEESNSLGNLVLHLDGNLRQWVGTTFGGQIDQRARQQEFDQRDAIAKDDLLDQLQVLQSDIEEVFTNISADDLLRDYAVQGYRETGIAILIHITEHFSYHVGQATYLVKMLTGKPTDYYAGQDLDAHG